MTALVNFTGAGTRLMIGIYAVTMAALALWSIEDVRSPWPTLIGIAVLLALGVLLAIDRAEPMGVATAVITAVAWVGVALLVSWQVTDPGGHAQWFYGAGTVSLFFVGLRGRPLIAWTGFAALSAVVVVWATTTGLGPATALLLIGKQLPIMLVSSLFAYGMQRTTATILRLSEQTAARAAVEAAQRATTAERNDRLAELDAIATPLLSRLVDDTPLTAEERLEFAVAEAQLRDGVRARSLVDAEVVAAARDARRRGVHVVLLDDLHPAIADPEVLSTVRTRVVAALRSAADGRVVARLLPAGRESAATILVDGEDRQHRETVPGNDEGPATGR